MTDFRSKADLGQTGKLGNWPLSVHELSKGRHPAVSAFGRRVSGPEYLPMLSYRARQRATPAFAVAVH
jgi:hypothetical protein